MFKNGVVLVTHLCLMGTTPLMGQKDNLARLDSITVRVAGLDADAQAMGITQQGVQTKVELELRKAGVMVREKYGMPILRAQILALSTATGGFAFTVILELEDFVVRSRDLDLYNRAPALGLLLLQPTWSNVMLGITPASGARSYVMGILQSLIDKFLNDYLAANPR